MPALPGPVRAARAVARRGVARAHRNTTSYSLRIEGKTVAFDTRDPVAHQWFYPRYAFNRLHEPPVTSRMVKDLASARCFADVGANLGYYTCLAAHAMQDGEVHAFEMDQDNFALLQRNVELNPTSREVRTLNAAVSAQAGEVTYRRHPERNHPALSIYNPWPTEEEVDVTVPAVTMDEYFADKCPPDLVKIDVEGAELDVLRGMTGVLPHVQRMYLEVHPQNLEIAGQSPTDLFELLVPHLPRLHEIVGHRNIGRRQANVRGELVELDPATPVSHNMMVLATR